MSSNTTTVNNFILSYNSFNIDKMLELLHPDVQFKNISDGIVNTQTSGKDEFEKLARQSATLFKEREQKIVSIKELNNKVIVEISYSAIFAVDLPNGLKAGERIEMNGKSEYEFKYGLIYSIVDES